VDKNVMTFVEAQPTVGQSAPSTNHREMRCWSRNVAVVDGATLYCRVREVYIEALEYA
jgi:hypothetical protein